LKRLALFSISFFICAITFAAPVSVYTFETKEQEKIFHRLSDELRCLVCQNQNIAESNSELAQDLRRQIADMLHQGKSEDDIVSFMVERYGDYVLFNPPFKPLTWLLWLGPLMIFIFGAIYASRIVISKRSAEDDDTLGAAEISRLDSLKSEMMNINEKDMP